MPTPARKLRKYLDLLAAVGEVFDEMDATLDMMLALDRNDIKPERYYALRWQWTKSRVHRQKATLIKTAINYRQFRANQDEPRSGQNTPKKQAKKPIVNQDEPRSNQYRQNTDTISNNSKELSLVISAQEVMNSWNEFALLNGLAPIRKITKKRKSWIAARGAEIWPLIDEIYLSIQNNSFYLGGGPRGWRVTFDYIWKNEDNYNKILENGQTTTTGGGAGNRRNVFNAQAGTSEQMQNSFQNGPGRVPSHKVRPGESSKLEYLQRAGFTEEEILGASQDEPNRRQLSPRENG